MRARAGPGHPPRSTCVWKIVPRGAFGGAEEEVSGACHFAGEHTTQDYQGYLQGAVFSGQRAAAEVLEAL